MENPRLLQQKIRNFKPQVLSYHIMDLFQLKFDQNIAVFWYKSYTEKSK